MFCFLIHCLLATWLHLVTLQRTARRRVNGCANTRAVQRCLLRYIYTRRDLENVFIFLNKRGAYVQKQRFFFGNSFSPQTIISYSSIRVELDRGLCVQQQSKTIDDFLQAYDVRQNNFSRTFYAIIFLKQFTNRSTCLCGRIIIILQSYRFTGAIS